MNSEEGCVPYADALVKRQFESFPGSGFDYDWDVTSKENVYWCVPMKMPALSRAVNTMIETICLSFYVLHDVEKCYLAQQQRPFLTLKLDNFWTVSVANSIKLCLKFFRIM